MSQSEAPHEHRQLVEWAERIWIETGHPSAAYLHRALAAQSATPANARAVAEKCAEMQCRHCNSGMKYEAGAHYSTNTDQWHPCQAPLIRAYAATLPEVAMTGAHAYRVLLPHTLASLPEAPQPATQLIVECPECSARFDLATGIVENSDSYTTKQEER